LSLNVYTTFTILDGQIHYGLLAQNIVVVMTLGQNRRSSMKCFATALTTWPMHNTTRVKYEDGVVSIMYLRLLTYLQTVYGRCAQQPVQSMDSVFCVGLPSIIDDNVT